MGVSRQNRRAGSRPWLRWMPAVAAPALIAALVLAAPLQAAVSPTLPTKTAEQLVAMVAGNDVRALSGTLQQSVDLGLPQLPAVGSGSPQGSSSGSAAATPGMGDVLEFLTTSHTMRIYVDGASRQRLQFLDTMAERDVVHNGNTVWGYDSASNTATKVTLPALPQPSGPGSTASAMPTPATMASTFLNNMDATTAVGVGPTLEIAGRSAYQLLVEPRTADTLIGKVTIAVDSATGLPLAVSVQAKGSTSAAFQLSFSQVTLAAPAASMFTFEPPSGTAVTRQILPAPQDLKGPATLPAPGDSAPTDVPRTPTTTGSGWSSIVQTPAGTVPASLTQTPQLAQILQAVSGGYALHTSLFTALITPDGRLLAGAVPLAALQAAAAAPANPASPAGK